MIRLMLLMMVLSSTCYAGQVEIKNVKITPAREGYYRVDVTLKHADTGWDHYADGWQVLDRDKKVVATRTLYHPHVDEQPFTRSLYDVKLPAAMKKFYIRAHDKVHGNSELYEVNLE